MNSQANPIIDAMRVEHDALAALVQSLDEADLTGPSAASEWTIAQVLSHLGSASEIGLASLDAALTGIDTRDPDFNQRVWDRWNAKSAADVAADFVAASDAIVTRYESIDEATRESLRIDLAFLPQPIDLATLGGMRLNEFTLHAWDVLVAFDPSAALPAPGPSLMIDRFALLFGYLGHADALEGKRGVLAVHTNEPDRRFGLELGDSISLVDEPAEPDGVLTLPAEAWLRLIAGRLAPEHTPASVTVTGGLVGLDELRRVFPGY